MRFLLVNPERLTQPPFGLLYIGAVLEREGHDVRMMEMPFVIDAASRNALLDKEMKDHPSDVVGITFMTPQAQRSREIISHLKEHHKNIKTIAGGVHPTLKFEEILSWGADLVCVGEGEETVKEMARALAAGRSCDTVQGIACMKDTRAHLAPPRPFIKDIDTIPFPAYHLIDSRRFARRTYAIRGLWLRCGLIMTARGCPARCTFCCGKTVHGRVVREFSVPRVVDEVEWLYRTHRIEGFWVIDDTFSLKEPRVVNFCEELKRRTIDLIWACQARVDTFTEPMAKAMRSSGCVQIDFGVESGSQRVLDSLHKGIKVDQTKRAFGICKRNGIRPVATVMIGSPGETKEDIKLTKALLDEIKPAFLGCFFCTPFPGTEIYDMAVKNAWIDLSKPVNWQTMEYPVMTATLTEDELKREFEVMQRYNKSSAFGYMTNPAFIYDMLRMFLKNTDKFLKLLYFMAMGRRRDAINTFLFVFRKEFLD